MLSLGTCTELMIHRLESNSWTITLTYAKHCQRFHFLNNLGIISSESLYFFYYVEILDFPNPQKILCIVAGTFLSVKEKTFLP